MLRTPTETELKIYKEVFRARKRNSLNKSSRTMARSSAARLQRSVDRARQEMKEDADFILSILRDMSECTADLILRK
jgi:hypothetical protein